MLYKKNNTKELDMKLFENPTSEYRGTPFWAWNCVLKKEVLLRQIECFKKMGLGGFHMHTRAGMATEYLGKEFMELIKACRDKAEEENMLAWLYDEDRWASGSAGGMVTKTKAFRQKALMWSETPVEFCDKEKGVKEGLPYLIGIYDVVLNGDKTLKSYKKINEGEKCEGMKRYAYVKTADETGWFNNQTYVDTLDKNAVKKFLDITVDGYKDAVGESFGKSVPAIFTDEPHFTTKKTLPFADSHADATIPWTTDFADTFKAAYGIDITETLPEIFYDLPNEKPSRTRYCFHDHVCERFVDGFSEQYGERCKKYDLALTGHVLGEESLASQTSCVSEAMRSYRGFTYPGIDMLCNHTEFTTAKQTQSVCHQMNKEAMMSELYGVTNWNFDFRGHKFQGDWQAALGVNIRVQHLAWVSMKGSAKRDYPASIGYQSPWYDHYSYIEDHFARVNTVLTRGKPLVDIGVIHPIESFWIKFGPSDTSYDVQKKLDDNFHNITEWLISGMADFDFISESMLPGLYKATDDKKLSVGSMNYKTVVVPGCINLRKTTFDILKKFAEKGGKLIFVGECPKYVELEESEEIKKLYDKSIHADCDKVSILNALDEERNVKLINTEGKTLYNMIHAMRQDGDAKWLFIAHCKENKQTDVSVFDDCIFTLDGEYIPTLYNTITGKTEKLNFKTENGKTYICKKVYSWDSLLIKLEEGRGCGEAEEESSDDKFETSIKGAVSCRRCEDNVVVLDMPEYSVDGGEFMPKDEMLRIDFNCRKLWDYPLASGEDIQPWAIEGEKIEHHLTFRFTVNSEADIENCFIAGEEAEKMIVNGRDIALEPVGYYVDESIKKYSVGAIEKGENIIEITAPISKRISVENYFLLGDFDVAVNGCDVLIKEPSDKIHFGELSSNGMPFYGGNVVYETELDVPDCDLKIKTSRYRGAVVGVSVDGCPMKISAFAPYITEFKDLKKGRHKIEFTLFGTRINTFGQLHNCGYIIWFGANSWYTEGEEWSYEYDFENAGILKSPVFEIKEK